LTGINILTNREIEILFIFCKKNIKIEECSLLLLSLFLGRSLLKINKFQLIKSNLIQNSNQEHYCLSYIPKLPKHKVSDPRINSLIDRPEGKVVLPLPIMFNKSIKAILNKSVDIDTTIVKFNELIKKLNNKFNTNFTYIRIFSHFENWMVNQGIDTSEISFLLNRITYNTAGSYYYQPTSASVTNVFLEFQKYIYKQVKIQSYTTFITEDTSIKIGSQMGVSSSIIKQLFSSIRKRLLPLKENILNEPYKHHNLLVIYVLTLLNISCGHRPVCNPYESLNNLDLNLKNIFITDKETNSEITSRIIPLPEITVLQMKEYLHHLKQLLDLVKYSNTNVCNHIKTVFENENSPLFFIKNNKVKKIKPSILKKELINIWPLRINWHRHHMRTKLRSWNFPGELVDAWMGHSGFGGSGFGQYSGLSINDMQNISYKINDYLISKIDFQIVNSWKI